MEMDQNDPEVSFLRSAAAVCAATRAARARQVVCVASNSGPVSQLDVVSAAR
jgi:hypothetical protein